jgi:hypothetical protein
VFQGSWEVIKDKPGKGFATKSSWAREMWCRNELTLERGASYTEGLALGEKRLAELLATKTHRFSWTTARGRYVSLKHRKCVCVEGRGKRGTLQKGIRILATAIYRAHARKIVRAEHTAYNPTRFLQPPSAPHRRIY